MKVSIIIPFYNVAEYVDRCLSSALGQSFDDIEVIAVDDCSTDNTKGKIAYWAERDCRVVPVYKTVNEGLSAARNSALDIASGEYITFVDGDDCIDREYVAKLYSMVTDTDTAMAVCSYDLIDEKTLPENMEKSGNDYPTEIISRRDYFLRINSSVEIVYIIACGKIYHKSIFNNLRYANMLSEDEEIIHKIVSKLDRIAVCYEPLYYYTVRNGSIMRSSFNPKKMAVLSVFDTRKEYFIQNKEYDLAYMTMKKYMLKCLELYSEIGSDTENGAEHKKRLLKYFKNMMNQMKSNPVYSKRFLAKMMYYSIFPNKYSPSYRSDLLFK